MYIKIKSNGVFYFRNCFGVLCDVKTEDKCLSYDLSCRANKDEVESIVRNLMDKKQEVTLVPIFSHKEC